MMCSLSYLKKQIMNQLKLDKFNMELTIKAPTVIFKQYYDNVDLVGYVYYNMNNGKIELLYITDNYRNKGLGKEILNNTIEEMKLNNIKEVWCSASRHHEFWNSVYNGAFTYRYPIKPGINHPGFFMKI